ncbi:MAG: MaoC family dehydratase [Deltaproteobacteria bacterium]|nr:MaoC family dehydratase [Deltaproteobacteria bacterium]
MASMRMRAVKGIRIGDRFCVTRTFTERDVIDFAETTRDYNPVHFDRRFTAIKNFRGRICHGLLVGSLLTEIGGQVGWLATEMNFKFKKPVYIGDTVTCELTIKKMNDRGFGEAEVVFTHSDGTVVIEAEVKGNLPGGPEREVMRQMLNGGDPTNPIGKACKVD